MYFSFIWAKLSQSSPYNLYSFKNKLILTFKDNMNKMHDRVQTSTIIPVTPNLQQYKLHGKLKGKKKNGYPSIQPTLQPIQTNMHQGCNQKYPTTPTNNQQNSNKGVVTCLNHPDRKAIYISKDNNKKYFCALCAVTDGGGDSKFMDEQRYEKTKSIQIFKKRVNALKQSIGAREKEMLGLLEDEQDRYGEYFSYLSTSFKNMIQDIEQKHRQLNNTLIQSIRRQKQSVSQSLQIMQTIKQSIQRYIYDINYNYEQILAELSIDHFRDIMKQYNTKIQYYNQNVLRKINKQELFDSINVYLPIQEIRRVIDKANIQYLGETGRMGSTRSLQKFMSNTPKQYVNACKNQRAEQQHERNDRKSESKGQQRKRNNTQNMVHQIRGANKQNNYMDSYYNSQLNVNDQRGYQD